MKDGTLISAGGGGIRFWDIQKKAETRKIETTRVWRLALSRDNKLLASYTGSSPAVDLYDPATGKLVRTLPDCGGGVAAVAFSPDGKKLVTGGTSRALRVWDVATGKEIGPRPGHLDAVVSLAFSPDGKHLASRGSDQTARVWDWKARKELHRLSLGRTDIYHGFSPANPAPTATLAYSPNGKTLVASGGQVGKDGLPSPSVHLWDTSDFSKERRVTLPQFAPTALAFSPDSGTLVTVARNRQYGVRLWDVARADWHTVLDDPNPERRNEISFRYFADDAAFSPDGRTLAVAATRKVVLWDWHAGRYLRSLPEDWEKARPRTREAHRVAFTPGGHLLAAAAWPTDASYQRVVHFYEPDTGGLAFSLTVEFERGGPPVIHTLAVSPDGRLLALACGDGRVRVWDVFAWKQLAAWEGHKGDVLSVAFSPDGKTLASGGMDTTILLWDLRKLRLTRPAPGNVNFTDLAADLRGKDAARAYRALWAMAAHGDKAVTRLGAALRPAPKLDRAEVKRLVGQLDSDDGAKRDDATAALEKLGRAVAPSLRKALAERPPAEARKRIERVLAKLDASRGGPAELFASRAVLALELVGTPAARAALKELAAGEPDAPLTRAAKGALVRCEKVR